MSRTRYIISTPDKTSATAALQQTRKLDTGARMAKRLGPAACVLSCEPRAAEALQRLPNVFYEQDLPLIPPEMPGLTPAHEMLSATGLIVQVVNPNGQPIPDVTVFAQAGSSQFRTKTGSDGIAELGLPKQVVSHLIVSPAANYWSRLVPISTATPEHLQIILLPLRPAIFSAQIRSLLALPPRQSESSGGGIRVAVVDSGIARHPALQVNGGYNTVDALGNPAAWNTDDSGHGTHCAGVIAATDPAQGYSGLAPGVELFAVRVFPGGFVSDLIEALDWCIANNIDIANMSLSSTRYSPALDQAVQRAYAAGVTVVAATGNQGREVGYPARLTHTIGVAAYGHPQMFPGDSAHVLRIGAYTSQFGAIFGASFSNRGEGVSVIAPGVSIISTVPGGYAAWDGTSMAAPIVTAHLARTLSHAKTSSTREAWQSAYLHHHVSSQSWPTGLPRIIEGYGQLLYNSAEQ